MYTLYEHLIHISSLLVHYTWSLHGVYRLYVEFTWSLLGVYLDYMDYMWSLHGVYINKCGSVKYRLLGATQHYLTLLNAT
jgi:hypothetical protein